MFNKKSAYLATNANGRAPLMSYRLYSFVANHYLSPLQCGLQTAHVVSNIFVDLDVLPNSSTFDFDLWASRDKTIIICAAGNHQGVKDCWQEIKRTGVDALALAGSIFYEDEQSMNCMATACGVIVPEQYWAATPAKDLFGEVYAWEYRRSSEQEGVQTVTTYPLTHPEGQFISHLKSYRLA